MSRRSERKKREEEAMRRKEQMRRQMIMRQRYMAQNPQPMNQMCYGPMSNTNAVPGAMPSRFIQLTPIVQPIAMVPYSTQNQPIMMYGDQSGMMGPMGPGGYGGLGGYGDDDDYI